MTEIAVAIALVAGFLLEWRRLGAESQIAALEQRIALLETHAVDPDRLAHLEATLERIRRNL